MTFCRACGQASEAGKAFCTKCGAPVAGVPATNAPPTGVPPAGTPEPRSRRGLGIALGVVLVIAVAGAGGLWLASRTSADGPTPSSASVGVDPTTAPASEQAPQPSGASVEPGSSEDPGSPDNDISLASPGPQSPPKSPAASPFPSSSPPVVPSSSEPAASEPAASPDAGGTALCSRTVSSLPNVRKTAAPAANRAVIRDLQAALAALGFEPGPVDGWFGARTDTAVRSYQASRQLIVDGLVGQQTWTALWEESCASS